MQTSIEFFVLFFLIGLSNGQTSVEKFASAPAEDSPSTVGLMDMKLSEILRLLQVDPGYLMQSATKGDASVVEKLRVYAQEKMLGIVSIPCYADLGYFTQELVQYALSVYRLTNYCANSTLSEEINCDCAKTWQAAVDAKSWTMAVLDSTGRGQAGVFQGNLFLTGNFEQCINIKQQKNAKGEVWAGHYCRVDVGFYQNQTCSTTHVLKSDTCFPASCTQRDVEALVNASISHLSTADGNVKDLICRLKVLCHEEMSIGNDGPAILIILILALAFTLMLSGTLYDYYSYQPVIKTLPENFSPLRPDAQNGHAMTKGQFADNQSWFVKLLLAFSVYSNGIKLFDTTKRLDQIHCLHGVRFLSMSWIIFGHTYYWSGNYINNIMQAYTLPPRFLNQMLLNASLAVDAFFIIAAMLLVYLWMKKMKQTNGRLVKSPKVWFMFYFNRYVRLTPLYAMILAIDALLIPYVADGPMWNQEGLEGSACKKSWWTNLLYVNNFFQLDDQCMSWSWYLANDMQFYIISPIFLVLLWWNEIVGIISIVLTILATGIIRAVIILSHENWPPISIFSIDEKQFDLVEPYWRAVYIKPYCRCGPFLIGLLLGYAFHKTQLKVDIPRWAGHIGWILAAGLGVGIVFGLYDYSNTATISTAGTAIYGGFGRTLWAIALSWVIFACSTGYGGPVNSILSWKLFMPLSKLVYAAYLLHPVLIIVYYASQQKPFHYSGHYHYVSYFLVNLLLSFFIALILSMAFEIPIQGIENIIFGHNHEKEVQRDPLKPKATKKGDTQKDDGETSTLIKESR